MTWPETDDIPPMGNEPEPPPFAVAAPLDEESFAVWAPGRVMRPIERLVGDAVADACNPPPAKTPDAARRHDGAPSKIGLDCCEDSRDLNRCGLRYYWLLGECLSCGATKWTAQPRGWSGPVRPPCPPRPKPRRPTLDEQMGAECSWRYRGSCWLCDVRTCAPYQDSTLTGLDYDDLAAQLPGFWGQQWRIFTGKGKTR